MKQTVTETMFIEGFERRGRDRQFSDAALEAMFEFYTELENGTGEEMEYDPVAFCCEWAEYTLDELRQDYPDEIEGAEDLDEAAEALDDVTTVIPVDDETILVMAF